MTCSWARRVATARTFLFVPGSRPDRFATAASSGADVVVLDLEDSVAAADKGEARRNVVEWLSAGHEAVVRVNGRGSSEWATDLDAVVGFDCVVMVPKSEDPASLSQIGRRAPVIALIETARGVLAAAEISAASGVVRTAFGHIDLSAELGIDPGGREALLHSRTVVVVAAAAAGIEPPIDGVTTDVSEPRVAASDAVYAKSLGFSGKLCIHPSQIGVVDSALHPTPEEVAWADSVSAASVDGGVVSLDGHMIDAPVVARARRILATARLN